MADRRPLDAVRSAADEMRRAAMVGRRAAEGCRLSCGTLVPMRTLGEFLGRASTPDGATYRWRTLAGSTAVAHVRLTPMSRTLVAELDEAKVERVIHEIARFLVTYAESPTCDVWLALHSDDRGGGLSSFGQLLEKLMSHEVLSRTRLAEIVAAHPELAPITQSFAAIWFDREGEYL